MADGDTLDLGIEGHGKSCFLLDGQLLGSVRFQFLTSRKLIFKKARLMTEQYFTVIKGGRGKRWGKDLGDYLTLNYAERVELKNQLDAVGKEFIKLHVKNLRSYGTVFGSDASRGYPKPVISGDNMPKGAALHPKKTPRDAEGKAKLQEFGVAGLYGHFIHLVSDRIKKNNRNS